MQAAAEGVDLSDKVTLRGAEFRIADEPGVMARYQAAYIAREQEKGGAIGYVQSNAAMWDVLYSYIDEQDWDRFVRYAIDCRATEDELEQVMTAVVGIVAARPPRSPSVSSTGRRQTSENSKGSSPKTDTPPGMISIEELARGL